MKMARVILFIGRIDKMTHFYGEVLDLKELRSKKDWREFAAGGATIALYFVPSSPGPRAQRSSSTPKTSSPTKL